MVYIITAMDLPGNTCLEIHGALHICTILGKWFPELPALKQQKRVISVQKISRPLPAFEQLDNGSNEERNHP